MGIRKRYFSSFDRPSVRSVGFMMPAAKCFQASVHQPVLFTYPGAFQILQSWRSRFGHLNTPDECECLQAHFPIFG